MSGYRSAGVRVPCSTSNLGSGFDTLGLALDRYLEARFEPGEASLEIVREGTLEGLAVDPAQDILMQSLRAGLDAGPGGREAETPRGRLVVRSDIPVARGLGSSAAASVAGWILAQVIRGEEPDRAGAFHATARREGHGDNAAPCAFGGFQAVVDTRDGIRSAELPLHDEVGLAYAAPAAGVSTQSAREVLPPYVTHGAAVAGLGRIAALLQGLATADGELIRVGIQDELHVPHRLALIPGAVNAMSAGYDAGAWGVTISGSGSGLIAFAPVERAEAVADALLTHLSPGREPGSVAFAARPDRDGPRIL